MRDGRVRSLVVVLPKSPGTRALRARGIPIREPRLRTTGYEIQEHEEESRMESPLQDQDRTIFQSCEVLG